MAVDGSTPSGPDQPSVGELVRNASEQVSALVRAEIELAKTELTGTAKRGARVAIWFAAAVFLIYPAAPFFFVMVAELLVRYHVLPRWGAYGVVVLLFVLLSGICALLGVRSIRKLREVGKPERTLDTVRDTARWARHPTSRAEAGH